MLDAREAIAKHRSCQASRGGSGADGKMDTDTGNQTAVPHVANSIVPPSGWTRGTSRDAWQRRVGDRRVPGPLDSVSCRFHIAADAALARAAVTPCTLSHAGQPFRHPPESTRGRDVLYWTDASAGRIHSGDVIAEPFQRTIEDGVSLRRIIGLTARGTLGRSDGASSAGRRTCDRMHGRASSRCQKSRQRRPVASADLGQAYETALPHPHATRYPWTTTSEMT